MQRTLYDSEFFRALEGGVERSAEACADLFVERFRPSSAIDLGCGTGLWLAALKARGVSDFLGVDGPWVPRDRLAIPESHFREHDLTMPFEIARDFDLALCLETAEHLPPECAPTLVKSLTMCAPVVIFSAAVPGQGGSGHINEQWPSFWTALFAGQDYQCSTDLRELVWNDEAIEVWYRQNMLCFASPTYAQRLNFASGVTRPLDIVHPDLFARVRSQQIKQAGYAARLKRELQMVTEELRRRNGDV